jgi:hypothetical protein
MISLMKRMCVPLSQSCQIDFSFLPESSPALDVHTAAGQSFDAEGGPGSVADMGP